MSETESRKLSDLRVVDLRSELEKRGLDRSGNKQALVERLQKALTEEGHNPETYQFDTSEKKPAKRLSTSSRDQTDMDMSRGDTETPEGDGDEDAPPVKQAKLEENEENSAEDNQEPADDPKDEDDKTQDEGKGEEANVDPESPIRLTLDEGEAFHDEEAEPQDNERPPSTSDVKNGGSTGAKEDPTDQQDVKKDTSGDNASEGKSSSKNKKSNSQNRNLWITNISKTTRATELKQALSAYGKVIGAKVVTNARFPGACCYGYVTMDTVADADKCIEKLNNTELNGQIIKIEKVRPDHMNPLKLLNKKPSSSEKEKEKEKPKSDAKTAEKKNESTDKKESKKEEKRDEKKDEKNRSSDKRNGKEEPKKPEERHRSEKRSNSKDRSRAHSRQSRSSGKHDRSKSRSEKKHDDILTFDKIIEEREKNREHERRRIQREEYRKRKEEEARQRDIERRQRNEAIRLEREREKLRIEREKLEREKAEIIRLERERQKLEREKLELEKLEIQRAKMRLQEEDRRAVKRPSSFRREDSFEERKRVPARHYDEAPPPPRFDPPPSVKPIETEKKFSSSNNKPRIGYDKHDFKRDREYDADRAHQTAMPRAPPTAISKYENSNVFNLGRERDMRNDPRGRDNASSVSGSRIVKDSRYPERERDRSPHFRPVGRDDRDRRIPDHKPDMRSSRDHRYSEPSKDGGRFDRGSGGNWNHPGASNKVYNSSGTGAPSKPWNKEWRPNNDTGGGDRWASNSSRGAGMSGNFGNSPNMNMGPTCPPPPGLNNYPTDRYEYKNMGSNMRKY